MKKLLKVSLKVCITALLFALCVGVSACGPSSEQQENPDVFTAEVSDVYIKLGDNAFDFSADLPQGVTVDSSNVNFASVGAYKIVYKQGKATQEKIAYVCGAPVFSATEGEISETVTVTYGQANKMDFMQAGTCGIVVKDSFGNELRITASADEYYIGDYGTYTVKYSATDYAGNVAEYTVTYSVTGDNAPEIDFDVPDVTDDVLTFSAEFSQSELNEMFVYINGEYVERADYEKNSDGIVMDIKCFISGIENGHKTFNVRIETGEWYSEIPVEFSDVKTPVFEDLSFDKWVFTESEEITLTAPKKLKPQAIEFSYSLTGEKEGIIALDESGENLIITGKDGLVEFGVYTVTVDALRNGEVQSSKSARIQVYTDEEFEKVLLPLNSTQYDGELFAKMPAIVDFSYNEEMGAYRMWTDTPVTGGNSGDTLIFDETGMVYQKFLSGFQKYNYVAMDICFIEPPETGGTVVIYLQDRTGYPYQHTKNANTVAVYDESTGKRVDKNDLRAGVWYTYYCDACAFDSRVRTNSGTPLIGRQVKESLGYAGAYYLRNVRFVDEEFGGGRLGDGYVCQVGKTYTLPTFGESDPKYTVTPNVGVTVVNNAVRVTVAGEYQARIGNSVMTFTAYTETDYADIVADMTTEQFAGQFYGFAETANNPLVLVSYDETENAYKFVNNMSSPAGANQVRVTKDSEMYNKIMDANGQNKYLVFTVKVEVAPKETNHNMIFYFNKDANATGKVNQTLTTEGVVIYVSGTDVTATRATIKTDVWYDIYVPLGTFFENGTLIGTQGVVEGAFWIKSIRLYADGDETPSAEDPTGGDPAGEDPTGGETAEPIDVDVPWNPAWN